MRKLTFLFALLCVSVMGWAEPYCSKVVTTTIDYTSLDVTVTVKKQEASKVRVILDNEHITGIRAGGTFQEWGNGVWENQEDAVQKFDQGWTQDGTVWYKDFEFSTYPTTGNFKLYILMDHDAGIPASAGFTLTNIDVDNDCSAPIKTDPALSLSETAVTLDATVPETFQIVPSQSGDGAINYESSNDAIATVSNTGLVTAVARGTATITVSTAETATYAASSKTLTVTVTGPINWATEPWIGNGSADAANTEKWKMAEHGYVNIQQPGFATEAGIYTTFDGAITYCSLESSQYAVQGGGMCLYLSAFTAQVTEVLVIDATHKQYIFYVYKDGASGTAYLNDIVPAIESGVNFALETSGGWASATSGEAWRGNNGNNGDRWESASSDPQEWMVDLGRRRIFNTIQMRWEGAYGKSFTIDVSNDGTSWTTVKTITDQVLEGFPYEQSFDIEETTARYVRFHGAARGTGWGYSFWEFRVMYQETSVLTSIDLSSAIPATLVDGAGVVLTVQPKNQYGINMDAAVLYEITPAAAGHMSGNTYIPDQLGNASIRAYSGEVYSSPITVFGYTGSNLALGTSLDNNKIIAQSEYSPNGTDAFFATDGNMGSVWQGSATNGTEDTDEARTYDAWFVVDLGAFYDVDLVELHFEGACSQLYHIDFSEDNNVWSLGYNLVGAYGVNARNDYWTTLTNNTKVRYVRFWSTKAATSYGMKMYEFGVYGHEWVDTGDTDAPTMVSATVDSKTWNSVVLAVSATDNVGVTGFHVVDAGHGIDKDLVATDGKITITGLTAETAYNFTVKAKDAAHLESEGMNVAVTTEVRVLAPTTAAPVPSWPADQVKSLYSDTYAFAPASLNSYNEGWWNNPGMSESNISGNHYLDYYLNREGMIGVQFAETSMATMEKIHIDIWSSAAGTVTFRPIIVDDGALNDNRYTLNLAALQWNSFDIDMSEFGAHNWTKVFQYSIENYNAGGLVGEHICVDNVYFYRETPYVDAEAPTGASATLLNTTYISASIQVSAEDNSGAVLYTVKNGEVEVATGGGASGATVIINVPNLTPGTNYNLSVIAKDDAGNEASPVNVPVTTAALPAPAPTPTHVSEAVKSLYSDAYTPAVELITTNQDWWYAPTNTEVTFPGGNKALYYYNIHEGTSVLGWAFGLLNASGYQYLHLSVYPLNAGTIEVYPVIAPEDQFHKTQTLVANQWNEVVFDYTDNTFAPMTQLGFILQQALGSCIIDNVYFYKAPDLTRDDSWMAPGELGTICIPNGAIAKGGDIYELVGKNEVGKIVFATVENNEMTPGKPYLFEAKSNAMNFYYTDATLADAPDNSGAMKGTFEAQTLTGAQLTNVYYFAGHALWSCVDLTESGLSVPANRAWVVLDENMPTVSTANPAPGRRYITMSVNSKNTATGIGDVQGDKVQCTKVLMDGQFFILRGEKLYDATGRLVK